MDALTLLRDRVSTPLLEEPAPNKAGLEDLYEIAMRAPDHAQLKPARFLIFKGEGRNLLGDVFSRAALKSKPDLNEAAIQRFKTMPHRAPLIIAVIANTVEHSKVPEIEQLISVGCSIHSMQIALQAMGYGSMWRTGSLAYSQDVKNELRLLENEHIVGFLYVGTPSREAKKPAPSPAFNERVKIIDKANESL